MKIEKQKKPLALVTGLITIGIVVGVVLTANFNFESKAEARQVSGHIYTEGELKTVQNNTSLNMSDFNPNQAFTDIVEKVRPSIVSVYTLKTVNVNRNPFFDFFGRKMPDDDNHNNFREQVQGSGSGIIISKDGYILTNNHVVEDMDQLQVQLTDNREFPAELIGRDPKTDIALLKVDAEDLPISVLGNSDNVQIGEWVLAFGSPLNLTSTVTAGIVSAIGRRVQGLLGGADAIESFIQTDAAINPGNSGGALVNINGEVIGVNSAIATRTNYYMGYGFAVPINLAKSVVDDLMKYGEVRRGYLGVYIADVNAVVAKGVGLDKPQGVLVTSLLEGRAAEQAGIEEGDVILTVNDTEVNQPNELQAKIGTYNPGQEVEITIWRNESKKKIKVILQDREGNTEVAAKEKDVKVKKDIPNLGMDLKDLSERQRELMDLDGGVIVAAVERYSSAADAGMRQGDVIFEIDKKKVKSMNDFNDKIEKHKKGDVVRLKVRVKQDEENFDRLVFMEIPSNIN